MGVWRVRRPRWQRGPDMRWHGDNEECGDLAVFGTDLGDLEQKSPSNPLQPRALGCNSP